ncbi:MAG: capsular polysaccharide biosynthesis protein [Pseudomonadota bacterium]
MPDAAAVPQRVRRRLFIYNSGFLTQRRLRRILQLAGYSINVGLPSQHSAVAVWGDANTAHRGKYVARQRNVPLVRIEDAFLRSLFPGRAGGPPLGLLIDHSGLHFDPSTVSDLERLLLDNPLDDPVLLRRAAGGIARIAEAQLSKYTAFAVAPPPELPDRFVLVVDQTQNDASIRASGANRQSFRDMLTAAKRAFPDLPIVIKGHPETARGYRPGHFDASDADARVIFLKTAVSPHALFPRSAAIYTVSSQLGFEAILAGLRPHVFGQPFYAGWGLSKDADALARRQRLLTKEQLFAAAMILYPTWYDPYQDRLCRFEEAVEALAAQTRAWREDHQGWVASGMRLWKRKPLQQFFGAFKAVTFQDDDPASAQKSQRKWMVWAGKATTRHRGAVRVEDGFLRSRGLGATLVPALSLVCDDLGIYYDPTTPSRLEAWIAHRAEMRPDQEERANALIMALRVGAISKYNLPSRGTPLTTSDAGKRILVPGQVEDDASIRLGTGTVATNEALLRHVRAENPEAVIFYKPHPDVEAGLRNGHCEAFDIADQILHKANPAEVLEQVDEVWTMTSLMGFEALLRGVRVVTLGTPFYAGWGLTTDLGSVPARRTARPSLAGLVHATLIDYPRYRDPVTGLPCPVEVIVHRLAEGHVTWPGLGNRLLSKLQGVLASQAHLWRG